MKETMILYEEDMAMLAEKTVEVAERLRTLADERATVVLLEGDLGAGKTTFVKALASELGASGSDVHSPTFILKKEYKTPHNLFKRLVHIDAYRFTHPDEARVLRLEDDLRDPHTIMLVEWPSKMTYLRSDIELSFSVVDEETREVTISYEKE